MDIAFVDSASAGAAVRLDLSNPAGGVYQARNGLDIGSPELLGGSEGVGSEYGRRQVVVTLRLVATKAVAMAAQAAVAKELMRERNYLKVLPDGVTNPVWFYTYRSSPGVISLDLVEANVWQLSFSMDADPFALGAQESQTVTIENDPAVAGGLVASLSTIKGDAPAPAIVEVTTIYNSLARPIVGLAGYDAGVTPVLTYWQAEAWTLGTGAAVTADAAASGGSKITVTLSASDVVRLTGTVTPTFAGRYRLFARVKPVLAAAGSVFVTAGGTAQTVPTSATEMPNDDEGQRLIDLGEFAWPKGNMPIEAGYTLPSGAVTISAYSTASPVGTLEIDYVVAVPVDLLETAGTALLTFSTSLPLGPVTGTAVHVVDGELERTYFKVGTEFPLGTVDQGEGGYPMVWPGGTNRVLLFPRRYAGAAATPWNDVITLSSSVTVKYRPRFLWLAGS